MFMSPSFLYILSWVVALLSLSIGFFLLFIFHYLFISRVSFSLILFPVQLSCFRVSVTRDEFSSLFSSAVCLISAVVFSFSYYYFQSSVKIKYFIWCTFLFVASILILVNFTDVFFVMLGWDGLGVVSFFLIMYYQSSVSLYSAIFTLLINRLGDCFFVVFIILFFTSFMSSTFIFYDFYSQLSVGVIILVAFATKSALFPFSPWLPAAMAAPTPISSLVHSSTLVTAGLFLIIRRYPFISSYEFLQISLTSVGLFTSFYAGLSSLIEPDLKKVVALSTLSHLGFICLGLGLGCPLLAFVHLLAHAFFKSSLFVRLGALISQYSHYQDSRFYSRIAVFNPFFRVVILVSCANLIGLPFLSGFYSKDLILEVCSYSRVGGVLCGVMYLNLIFTYSYSFRVLLALSSPRFIGRYRNPNPSSSHMFTFLLGGLRLLSIPFVCLRVKSFSFIFFCSTLEMKFVPLVLLFVIFIINLMHLNSSLHSFYSPLNVQSVMLYGIINLSSIWGSLAPSWFLDFRVKTNRQFEYGGLYRLLITYVLQAFTFLRLKLQMYYLDYRLFVKLSYFVLPIILIFLMSFNLF